MPVRIVFAETVTYRIQNGPTLDIHSVCKIYVATFAGGAGGYSPRKICPLGIEFGSSFLLTIMNL